LALAVPLSRFTSRVGGGSAFYVRHLMARYRNPDSEHQIKRIDSKPRAKKQTHGFQVHFRRGDSIYTKLFSDSKHRDKEDARRAAREFRAYLEKQIPEAIGNRPARPNAVGYSFRERKNADGSITSYISATVRDRKGHAVNRPFRVIDGNLDAAIKAARDWRASLLAKRFERGETDA
jgi:hypothetical protein